MAHGIDHSMRERIFMKKNSYKNILDSLMQFNLALIGGRLCRFDDGIWIKFENLEAKRLVAKIAVEELGIDYIGKSTIERALEDTKLSPLIPIIDVVKVSGREKCIACKSGVFEFQEDGVLQEMSMEKSVDMYLLNRIDADLKMDIAKEPTITETLIKKHAPKFFGYLKSTFGDDFMDAAQSLLEMMGYVISNFRSAKKAFFLVGSANSGKSLMLNLVKAIVGEENVSFVELHKLGERFNKAELHGKLVNLCSEIPTKKVADIDSFKRVVGNDMIYAEFKGRDPFSFHCQTALLTAGNHLPNFAVGDGTSSISTRVHVLAFTKEISVEERDTQLEGKLIAEKDAIFSLAMLALKLLIVGEFQFTLTEDSSKLLNAYNADSKAYKEFVNDCCLFDTEFKVYKQDLWEAYQSFCEGNGIDNVLTRKLFFIKVGELPNVSSGKGRISGGKSLALFSGIKLKTY